MTSHIKLYESKSNRFEQLKDDIAGTLGYEPSNPEIVGLLMASYNSDALPAIRVPANARR